MAGGIRPGFDSVIVVKPGAALNVREVARQLWKIMDGMAGSVEGAGNGP
jgi:hypothetical protein